MALTSVLELCTNLLAEVGLLTSTGTRKRPVNGCEPDAARSGWWNITTVNALSA